MSNYIIRSASILNISMNEAGTQQIARRSRGTPRVANRLLRRVRDYAEVIAEGKITALDMMEVDSICLDEADRKLLETIIENFGGGPVGITTIAAAIDEEKDTIESIYDSLYHPDSL